MGWIIAILLGSFALVIIFEILIGRIELKYLISGPPDNNASLSRFQFLIFTFVIAMGLFLIIVSTQPQPAFPAIPGGILSVMTLTILYQIVPREQIGSAMGVYGLGVVFAPAVGPTLGGYLVEYTNWRLIFYINVPVGILGAIAAFIIFPRMHPTSWPKFDLWGFLAVGYGLFALLLATSKGQDWGWTGYRVLILLVSSALSLALFVVIELEVDNPLLDVRAFLYWPFTNSLLLIAVITTGLFTTLYYIPQFLQVNQGLQALNAGLVLLPSALVMVVLVPIAGRLYDKFGPRWPAVIGLTLTGVGTLLLTGINIDMTRPELIGWMMIRAAGLGLAMMPIMTGGISALPASIVSSGSAFNTLSQRVSSALGLAVLTALATAQQAQFMADRSTLLQPSGADINPQIGAMLQNGQAGLLPYWQQLQIEVEAQAYSNVFLVAGSCTLLGVVLGFFLRSGKAPGTDDAEPVEVG